MEYGNIKFFRLADIEAGYIKINQPIGMGGKFIPVSIIPGQDKYETPYRTAFVEIDTNLKTNFESRFIEENLNVMIQVEKTLEDTEMYLTLGLFVRKGKKETQDITKMVKVYSATIIWPISNG